MSDFRIWQDVLIQYTGNDEHVIVPQGINRIGLMAFCCKSLQSVVIPEGVTSVAQYAFDNCANLRSVVLPEGVISIDKIFNGCEKLRIIFAPGISIAELDTWAYIKFAMVCGFASNPSAYSEEKKEEYCKYMSRQKKRLLSSAVEENNIAVFSAYEQFGIKIQPALRDELIELANREQKTEVQAWLMDYKNRTADRKKEAKDKERSEEQQLFNPYMAKFLKSDWEWSNLDDGTIQIDKYKGENTEVMIPPCVGKVPVTTIGDNAFKDCIHLQSIVIPQGVTTIGDSAFYGCSKLESIDIPETVTKFGVDSFYQTLWLKTDLDQVIVNNVLIKYQGTDCEMTVPSNVTCIGAGAFMGNKTLKYIVIPNGVIRIGKCAFINCENLESIVIPEGITSIEEMSFMHCSKLQHITIPKSVSNIEKEAFAFCRELKSVEISEEVTSIGEGAFKYCSWLQHITIPKGVSNIENKSFEYCGGLKSVEISEGIAGIGDLAFGGCFSLESIVIPEGVTHIGLGAFQDCKDLKDITIPGSITKIGAFAFDKTHWLKSQGELVIVNGILIKYQGKKYQSVARAVRIPFGVTCIGFSAFSGYPSLQSVVIPPTVTEIDAEAFLDCENLREIEIPENVTSIGFHAFGGCKNLQNVRIPGKVVNIGDSAFSSCKKLKNVVIEEGVTNFGDFVFSGCYNLNRIVIPKTVVSIGEKAFANCKKLTIHASAGSYAEQFAKENRISFVALVE